jgi:hypothetical protein
MTDLATARAGFILQGTTLRGWCRRNGVDPGYAHRVLAGKLDGPAAKNLRLRITSAATTEQPRACA